MRRRHLLPALLAGAALIAHAADAAPPAAADAGRLTLATERVVVFKDGYALFIKRAGGVADAAGQVFSEEVPDGAVLGCFWATAADGRPVAMSAEWVERREPRERETACVTTLELLRANVGRAVTLGLEKSTVVGTLLEVLDLPAPDPAPRLAAEETADAARSGRFGAPPPPATTARIAGTVRELVPQGGQLIVVDTEAGRVALPTGDVRTVTGRDLVTSMRRHEEVLTRAKRLAFPLGADAAGHPVDLRILYFSEGVRWIPTYRVSGELVDQADIALQGELIDEAEDIVDAAIDLVVGVPNFRFKTTISPLSLEGTLRSALAAAAPGLMGNAYSNGSFAQRQGERLGRAEGEAAAATLAPELAAERQQDLFVYSLPRATIRNGMRATMPLWRATAALRHLYTLDIAVVRDSDSSASRRRDADGGTHSPLRLAEHQVWHQFELANAGAAPWTTGAALILRGAVPLGQELLTYTPAGGSSLLPVTVCVDMCGGYVEEEVGRQADALSWNGNRFALVRKTATVTVSNLRGERSRTRVTVSTGGRVSDVSDQGTVRIDDHRADDWQDGSYQYPNNHSDVAWDLDLAPGEVRTLRFACALYVR